jgi:hypothetical protein
VTGQPTALLGRPVKALTDGSYTDWPGLGSAPVSIALVTAAVRPETPSFAQARSRCVFTVASLM